MNAEEIDQTAILKAVTGKFTSEPDIWSAVSTVTDYVFSLNFSDYELIVIYLADELSKEYDSLSSHKLTLRKQVLKSLSDRFKNKSKSEIKENKQKNGGFLPLNYQLAPELFPDVRFNKEGEIATIKPTVNNLDVLLKSYGIYAYYDECCKEQGIKIPGANDNHDLANESALQMILSIAANNDISSTIAERLPIIMSQNTINPVKDWILSKEHDGVDRLPKIAKSMGITDNDLSFRILRTWLIQCLAALDRGQIGCDLNPFAQPKYEMVLILKGAQGIEKTKWVNSLLPRFLRKKYIIDGSIIDLQNKDSLIEVISGWIVELGEVDESFKKNSSSGLKAFISKQKDIIRLPFARKACNFARSTSFVGSVNKDQFLEDVTGSRRFGVIECGFIQIDYKLDMQQLWRQVWDLYASGEKWWLDKQDEVSMQTRNKEFESDNPIESALVDYFDFDSDGKYWTNAYSASEIYTNVFGSSKKPNRHELTEIKRILTKIYGVETKNHSGRTVLLMPIRRID